MKMKAEHKHKKRIIRAVYPNGSDQRGYQVVLSTQIANPFMVPHWLTKWAGNVTLQTLGGY
jgi:hypothetical protein